MNDENRRAHDGLSLVCYKPIRAAEILGITVVTLRRMIRRGDLRAARVGGQFRVTDSELRRLLGLGNREP